MSFSVSADIPNRKLLRAGLGVVSRWNVTGAELAFSGEA
jgi:hypothetical protein